MVFLILKLKYLASDTKIELHPDLFGKDNNPRIYGISSNSKRGDKYKKATFTSCKFREMIVLHGQ